MGTLVRDCTLIDCTGAAPLPDAAILVEDGRLADLGPRAEVVRRAGDGHTVVSLEGDTVLPGLWDAHVHLGAVVPPHEPQFRGEVDAAFAYRAVRKATDNLKVGITSLRTMGDRNNADLHLKRAIELEPRNRIVARQDADFAHLATQAPFDSLLYPEKKGW